MSSDYYIPMTHVISNLDFWNLEYASRSSMSCVMEELLMHGDNPDWEYIHMCMEPTATINPPGSPGGPRNVDILENGCEQRVPNSTGFSYKPIPGYEVCLHICCAGEYREYFLKLLEEYQIPHRSAVEDFDEDNEELDEAYEEYERAQLEEFNRLENRRVEWTKVGAYRVSTVRLDIESFLEPYVYETMLLGHGEQEDIYARTFSEDEAREVHKAFVRILSVQAEELELQHLADMTRHDPQ